MIIFREQCIYFFLLLLTYLRFLYHYAIVYIPKCIVTGNEEEEEDSGRF